MDYYIRGLTKKSTEDKDTWYSMREGAKIAEASAPGIRQRPHGHFPYDQEPTLKGLHPIYVKKVGYLTIV
jgi:hypothetical protein